MYNSSRYPVDFRMVVVSKEWVTPNPTQCEGRCCQGDGESPGSLSSNGRHFIPTEHLHALCSGCVKLDRKLILS